VLLWLCGNLSQVILISGAVCQVTRPLPRHLPHLFFPQHFCWYPSSLHCLHWVGFHDVWRRMAEKTVFCYLLSVFRACFKRSKLAVFCYFPLYSR
jgi:hypothetical protein